MGGEQLRGGAGRERGGGAVEDAADAGEGPHQLVPAEGQALCNIQYSMSLCILIPGASLSASVRLYHFSGHVSVFAMWNIIWLHAAAVNEGELPSEKLMKLYTAHHVSERREG